MLHEEKKRIKEMYLYEKIDEQPELKDSSSVLEEFYEEREDENIGLLREMDKRIEESDFVAAVALRDQILANNGLEAAYKNVLSLILKHEQTGLNATDSLDLLSWATSCSFVYGKIPSVAQVAYNCIYRESIIFEEDCTPQAPKIGTINPEIQSSFELTLFPNPTSERLHLRCSNETITKANCEIHSLDGKILFEGNFNFEEGIDLRNLSIDSGVYILVLDILELGETLRKQFIYVKE